MAASIATDIGGDELEWLALAECKGLDTNLFHSSAKADHILCKAICAKCPVVNECLAYQLPFDRAYSFDKQLGIYGGMTSEERRLYWDRLRRSKQPSRYRRY